MKTYRRRAEFVGAHPLLEGTYRVIACSQLAGEIVLANLVVPGDEADDVRFAPSLEIVSDGRVPRAREAVAGAAVRGGARHPFLRTDRLLALHRDAVNGHHVELFADLSALTSGLVSATLDSLRGRVSRVVVSSSHVDVLHEYQGTVPQKSFTEILRRNEMRRALALLAEMHEYVPVHVHQLEPGVSNYMIRSKLHSIGGTRPAEPDENDRPITYISEDRQMIAAFWDYLARSNPRLPIWLLTADHRLAHVCATERVPLVFAEAPHRAHPTMLETLWIDPAAFAFRGTTSQRLLWELALTFHRIRVEPSVDLPPFELVYENDSHVPGDPSSVTWRSPPPPSTDKSPGSKPSGSKPPNDKPPGSKPPNDRPPNDRPPNDRPPNGKPPPNPPRIDVPIRLALTSVVSVLPTTPGQRIALKNFSSSGDLNLRQLKRVGELTRLFRVSDEQIVGEPALGELVAALKTRDYEALNSIFRRVGRYDEVLRAVGERGEPFPSKNENKAFTGWAIALGAAYKAKHGVLFGLAPISDDDFEQAVLEAHAAVGKGQAAAPIAEVLDLVCQQKRISPVRFEAMLDRMLGHGALASFEAQRSTSNYPLPVCVVLTAPEKASSQSYLREMAPGKGIRVGGVLSGSLVHQPSRLA